ncbi:hypothetical protein CSTERLE_13805 [Thermoclostridium stercorarium subsp. leptospartum DSM 9219]|uniref:Regulatory protein YycH domain-containing protein n=1 Tax=Thermoclostridium stercorarium subsp. leptospartum DSM 9219 TaxID=1346611 RepID=A0A1B1YP80_THEST|nr:hypothetical protein [Thermoclostridium stercorarium]ANX02558.1 hypothetical protein CSTERLE_13805 [Thermoclostridium stercorarium subsp. leptospartum DSM 9219]
MRTSSLELKKTFLMIFLIILSVLQMGILWTEKNPGVPFLFSSQKHWYSEIAVDIDRVKESYIKPENIMVSDGAGGLYWKLDPNDGLFKAIWNDFKQSYLKQILDIKPTAGINPYEQDWYSLIKMKCIVVEFKNPIHSDIIRWIVDKESTFSTDLKQIYKIAIFPTESINNNENTLYVYDGNNVYKFVVKIEPGNMRKDDYIRAIRTIYQNENVIPMNRLIYFYPSVKNDDLIVSLDKNSEKKIWDLLVKTPDKIILNRDNVDKIEDYLLGDIYKSSMVKKFGEDGSSIIFSDTEKVLRYYKNGFLDYQYRNKSIGDKGTVNEAFEKAVTFIEYRRKLIEGVDILLSSVEEKNENYVFTFDYVMDGMEVKILDPADQTVKPAITIVANGDRVVDVKWYIKTFSNNDYYNFYSLYFFDIFQNKMIENYPDLQNSSEIYDISIIYICTESGMRAEPYWVIKTENQEAYLRMQGKGD